MIEDIEKLWTDAVKKALVGKTIVDVAYMPTEDADDVLGWRTRPVILTLSDGTILYPSSDDEGNGAGALFTNIKDLEIIPVIGWGERK